jgi:nucleoredoxin
MKAKHPDFEVVFVSSDRDEFNMGEYMRTHKMPWPAVRFGAADDGILKFSGSSIPWLAAVSDSGLPLTKNGVDKKYLPPTEVLNSIELLLGKIAAR